MNEKIIFPEFSYCDLLHHAPPFDSPLEEIFAYHFEKYKKTEITLYQQVQVNTICGPYWLDFAIKHNGNIIGIECDGKDYHETERDLWRDSMILGTGNVDSIYRFCGRDLNYHINNCLFLLSEAEPQLFSQRGIVNLNQLHSSESRGSDYNEKYILDNYLVIFCRNIDEESNNLYNTEIYIKRRKKEALDKKEPEWIKYFNFAKEQGSGNLKKIMEAYKNQREKQKNI